MTIGAWGSAEPTKDHGFPIRPWRGLVASLRRHRSEVTFFQVQDL
jgi:hypothetical protein